VGVPGDSWIDKVRRGVEAEPDGWRRVSGLSTIEAQMLLDWLEINDCEQRELLFDPQRGFTVRWFSSGAVTKRNPAAPD
jgi:hypothetical protein